MIKDIIDFIVAALPYFTYGLMVAIITASLAKTKSESKEVQAKAKSRAYAISATAFYITSIVVMLGSHGTSWITYMCLGSMFLCFYCAEKNKLKKAEKEVNTNTTV